MERRGAVKQPDMQPRVSPAAIHEANNEYFKMFQGEVASKNAMLQNPGLAHTLEALSSIVGQHRWIFHESGEITTDTDMWMPEQVTARKAREEVVFQRHTE